MNPFRYHILVCRQNKPEGVPSCPAKGGQAVLDALKAAIAAAGMEDSVLVTGCDCLGLCDNGPNLVVYPEGAWYSGVTPADADEIVRAHLQEEKPVERLARSDEGAVKQDIQDHFRKVEMLKQIMEKAGMIPEDINSLMRGFMESRAILSAIELDLFTAVGGGASAEQAASRAGTHPRATESLLNALVAVRVLKKEEGLFSNTPMADRYLREGAPEDSRTALMHVVHLWPRWSTLTDCVKKGTSVSLEKPRTEKQTQAFIAAMHKNASFRARHVVGVLDLKGVSRVLDLGGGSGAYAMEFARKSPEIEATVFDLPAVIPLAQSYIAEAGLQEKVKTVPGDMMADDLGTGHDLVLISAICHMWSPEENVRLFERIRDSLAPGGRVVIQDFVMDDDKTAPRFGALFALNMLVNTRGGGSYSGAEYVEWLGRAGFENAGVMKLPGPTDLVIATKA